MQVKRLRIFAGPNGSGKTSLKTYLESKKLFSLHEYINPDDLLRDISKLGFYKLAKNESIEELKEFAKASTYPTKIKKYFQAKKIRCDNGKLLFEGDALNSYAISLLVAYKCDVLLRTGKSFSLETVFSSKKKLDLIRQAKDNGYKIYLYSIATEDSTINKNRVESRVEAGGHDVPEEKISARYPKSLKNMSEAVKYVDRAFFWDNSTNDTVLIASFDAAISEFRIEVLPSNIPTWFSKYILDTNVVE